MQALGPTSRPALAWPVFAPPLQRFAQIWLQEGACEYAVLDKRIGVAQIAEDKTSADNRTIFILRLLGFSHRDRALIFSTV